MIMSQNPLDLPYGKEFIKAFKENPFLNYETLDDALAESKFTSQSEVLARMLNGENILIAGMPGAGKTHVIKYFTKIMQSKNPYYRISVTATTGLAALLLDGETIHKWSGLGVKTMNYSDETKREFSIHSSAKRKMRGVKTLIIDEISMMPAYFFTNLDALLKDMRRSNEPFGGVQLILVGDFLQLPPVVRNSQLDGGFAIQTEAWKNADIKPCFLDVTRRAEDDRLRRVLLEIAHQKVSPWTRKTLDERKFLTPNKGKAYTHLYTTNANVEKHNNQELNNNKNQLRQLEYKAWTTPGDFVRMDGSTVKRSQKIKMLEQFIKTSRIEKNLCLKKDAVVMVTSNIDENIVNGSIGRILTITDKKIDLLLNNGDEVSIKPKRFLHTEKKIEVDKKTGEERLVDEELFGVTQFPLKLAYATTVHKSQGQTLDGVVLDLSNCFVAGLGYVALSRVRSVDDLIIQGISDRAFLISDDARKINNYIKKSALKNREEFRENQAYYEKLLMTPGK